MEFGLWSNILGSVCFDDILSHSQSNFRLVNLNPLQLESTTMTRWFLNSIVISFHTCHFLTMPSPSRSQSPPLSDNERGPPLNASTSLSDLLKVSVKECRFYVLIFVFPRLLADTNLRKTTLNQN